MPSSRRYKLLCPIARALDRVGDRWTLLILRDLHAGPARFSDLQTGLSGIASNLLTDRLQQLVDDGLVERREGDFGTALYALTATGEKTRELLFELAMFGGLFPPDEDDTRRPGNLRTIAVTLSAACQRVITPETDVEAELIVEGERFTLTARKGSVKVRNTPAEIPSGDTPDVTMTTAYEPMVAAGDGRMALEEFVANHVKVVAHTPGKDAVLLGLLAKAFEAIAR